jgi:sRNA-binding regulator protein Hfq
VYNVNYKKEIKIMDNSLDALLEILKKKGNEIIWFVTAGGLIRGTLKDYDNTVVILTNAYLNDVSIGSETVIIKKSILAWSK